MSESGEAGDRTPRSGDGPLGSLAGPPALGRSIMVTVGDDVPTPWEGCRRIRVTEASLGKAEMLQEVRHAYLSRTPVIYEFADRTTKPSPSVDAREVWKVAPTFDFVAEAAWRLVALNSVDARDRSNPTWPPQERAQSYGATSATNMDADVELRDGTLAWCDGGPLTVWATSDERLGNVTVVPRTSIMKGSLAPVAAHPITASLASDQLLAVADSSTRARIIAPAGSGKTRVLTERARHLLKSGVPADSLLLLAYNTRAQSEMRERTTDLPELQIQTLNAMGLSIINGTNGFKPRGVTRKTILETEVRTILRTLHTFPRVRNADPLADWLEALTDVRLGLRSPDRVEASYGGDLKGFAELFPRYRQYLEDHNLVDFDEQIYLAIEVLLREWPVRFHAERMAEVLLVDEFQDLRPADMLLIRLLAGPALSVFAVGDDDQTIYGYSGATPEWLVDFEKHVPVAAHHALEVNYRCPAPVVRAALNLVSHNLVRVSKVIRSGPHNVTAADSLKIRKGEDQVKFAVGCIRELLDKGATPKDIAVLSRVNALLFPLLVGLLEAGVPVTFRDTDKFLKGSGIDAALAWLRLGVRSDLLSGADIMTAARRPSRSINPKVLEMMGEQSTLEGLRRLAKRLDERASKQITGFVNDVEGLSRHVERGTSSSTIAFIREQIGLDRDLTKLDASRQGKNKASTFDDMRALIALGRQHTDPKTFESWLKTSLAVTQDANGVELSTVHRVKGQEWPHVILYDVSEGIFPHRLNEDLDEERRVFHVAVTRCIESLTIVADSEEPSRFLGELTAPYVAPRRAAERPSQNRKGASRSHKPERSAPPRRAREPLRPVRTRSTSRSTTGSEPRQGDSIVATVGMKFRWGGYNCVVSALNAEGAEASFGKTRLTIQFGELVQVAGQYRVLARPT